MALADIAGQQRAVRFLKRLIQKDAVPHALLFSGMASTGKAAAANEFARALNCLERRGHDACGVCPACRKLKEGTHPDLIEVRSDGVFIKLEQVRELRRRFRFRPFEARFRVVIMHEAQRLRDEAANAILKVLEEPPGANIFILLVPESQMLLPTIVSRCCQVRFQPLEDEIVAQWLEREEGLSASRAASIARLAAGSIERARWFTQEEGAAGWQNLVERLESLKGLSMLDFFPMVAEWAKNRETAVQDIEFIRLWVRDLILLKLAGGRSVTFELKAGSRQAAKSVDAERLFVLYRHVERALQGLKVNANLQMTLEGVCLAIKDLLYGKGDWNSFPQARKNLSF